MVFVVGDVTQLVAVQAPKEAQEETKQEKSVDETDSEETRQSENVGSKGDQPKILNEDVCAKGTHGNVSESEKQLNAELAKENATQEGEGNDSDGTKWADQNVSSDESQHAVTVQTRDHVPTGDVTLEEAPTSPNSHKQQYRNEYTAIGGQQDSANQVNSAGADAESEESSQKQNTENDNAAGKNKEFFVANVFM